MEVEEGEDMSQVTHVEHIPLAPESTKSYAWSKDDVLSVSEEQLQVCVRT